MGMGWERGNEGSDCLSPVPPGSLHSCPTDTYRALLCVPKPLRPGASDLGLMGAGRQNPGS